MNFRDSFHTIAAMVPTLDAPTVYALAEKLAEPEVPLVNIADKESLGHFALSVPAVVAAAQADQKIVAIKHLRAVTQCGLKEAKDAVESLAFTRVYPNFTYRSY